MFRPGGACGFHRATIDRLGGKLDKPMQNLQRRRSRVLVPGNSKLKPGDQTCGPHHFLRWIYPVGRLVYADCFIGPDEANFTVINDEPADFPSSVYVGATGIPDKLSQRPPGVV
jgi:hypothetical protein